MKIKTFYFIFMSLGKARYLVLPNWMLHDLNSDIFKTLVIFVMLNHQARALYLPCWPFYDIVKALSDGGVERSSGGGGHPVVDYIMSCLLFFKTALKKLTYFFRNF